MATLRFAPRAFQQELLNNFKRFNVYMIHRRSGKTYFAVNKMLIDAISLNKPRPKFAYLAPEKEQGVDVVWKYFCDFAGSLPGVTLKETSKEIIFDHNGAVIKIIGLKEPNRLRGQYFDGVIIDEYSQVDASAWGEIIYPCLTDRDGWAIVMGTPQGDDHFHDMFKKAELDESGRWYAKKLTVYDTGVFNESKIQEMQNEMTNAQFAQEYLCDSYADFSNKYYLELMQRAQEQGRIAIFDYNPKHPVFCSWDLGRDGTAIWFAQKIGHKIHLIDYWEKTNCKLKEAIQVCLNKGYIYRTHFVPHDSTRETIESEYSTFNQLKNMGLRPYRVKKIGLTEGISMVQSSLINCHFDVNKCLRGIDCLKNYQAKIDRKKGIMLDEPIHDQYSHGADAMRYLIAGFSEIKNTTYAGMEVKINTDYDEFNI